MGTLAVGGGWPDSPPKGGVTRAREPLCARRGGRGTDRPGLRDREIRDQALAFEQLAGLVERQVVRRDDRVRSGEIGVRQPRAVGAHRLRHSPQQVRQPRLVAGLKRLLRLLVELVQALRDLGVDLELSVAHHPNDHCFSSFWASPFPTSDFICSSSRSTWPCEAMAPSSRSSWVWSEVKSSSAPEVVSSSIADARACICSVLSFARWMARPVSAICSPMPVAASPIRTCASAAEYCALIVSFCVRKASTLAESAFSLATSFSCCCSSCCACWSRPCSCCCRPDLRSSACRARSSRPWATAWRACVSSLTMLC